MNKEQIIQGYLMNSPRVVAEMLYDTIERYEEKIKELTKEFFIDDCKDCTYNLSSRSEKEPYCSVCREYNKVGEKND